MNVTNAATLIELIIKAIESCADMDLLDLIYQLLLSSPPQK